MLTAQQISTMRTLAGNTLAGNADAGQQLARVVMEACNAVELRRKGMTPAESEIFDAILDLVKEQEHGASTQQIADRTHRSKVTAHFHVGSLRRKGFLQPAKPRMAYQIVPVN